MPQTREKNLGAGLQKIWQSSSGGKSASTSFATQFSAAEGSSRCAVRDRFLQIYEGIYK